jgi:type IV secretory pathway component VirB8
MDIFNNKMKPLEEFNWVKIKLNHQSKVKLIRMLSGFFFILMVALIVLLIYIL